VRSVSKEAADRIASSCVKASGTEVKPTNRANENGRTTRHPGMADANPGKKKKNFSLGGGGGGKGKKKAKNEEPRS